MSEDFSEAAFRAHMRWLAQKGGAATKRRRAGDPRYYSTIGRLGGQASAAARRQRAASEPLEPALGDAPQVVEAPSLPPREASSWPESAARVGRRAGALDGSRLAYARAQAEAEQRRRIGLEAAQHKRAERESEPPIQLLDDDDDDDVPWDPWS
jgi:general stress protein YciG